MAKTSGNTVRRKTRKTTGGKAKRGRTKVVPRSCSRQDISPKTITATIRISLPRPKTSGRRGGYAGAPAADTLPRRFFVTNQASGKARYLPRRRHSRTLSFRALGFPRYGRTHGGFPRGFLRLHCRIRAQRGTLCAPVCNLPLQATVQWQ